jgi:cytochrome c peroxidase
MYRFLSFLTTLLFIGIITIGTLYADLTPKEQLGKSIFFDTNLSDPIGQSCAACHNPGVGFVGPDSAINAAGSVYEGAVAGRFGNRKPPSAAYGGDSPLL